MAKSLFSKTKVDALFTALFLIGLAIILYLNAWWPGMMLVIGIPLALRQFFLGRYYDATLTLLIFGGFFIIAQFDISWKILVPILLIMGAVTLLCREWIMDLIPSEKEKQNVSTEKKKKH